MNQSQKDKVIVLAKEKGACTHREHWELYPHIISFGPDELFAFAKAVQDKHREKDAKICAAMPDHCIPYECAEAIRAAKSQN